MLTFVTAFLVLRHSARPDVRGKTGFGASVTSGKLYAGGALYGVNLSGAARCRINHKTVTSMLVVVMLAIVFATGTT